MPGRRRPRGLPGLLVVVLLAIAVFYGRWPAPPRPDPDLHAPGAYRVERVIDGDTLLLANGLRVRLIGADAPETVHPEHDVEPWGPEATAFTERFVAGGEVELTFDGQRTDRYGRLLAYVWVDGRMLNEELIRAGLATAETHYRFSEAVKLRFEAAESEARLAGRGIWAE